MNKYVIPFLLLCSTAYAGDPKFWGHFCDDGKCDPAEVHQWFPTVMQPGHENDEGSARVPRSCCGEGDAYAIVIDEYIVDPFKRNGLVRFHVPDGHGVLTDGQAFTVDSEKTVQNKYGNPTEKEIAFISAGSVVYCIVPQGGD